MKISYFILRAQINVESATFLTAFGLFSISAVIIVNSDICPDFELNLTQAFTGHDFHCVVQLPLHYD